MQDTVVRARLKPTLSTVGRQTGLTLAATLAVQASTFLVLAFAPLALSVERFAELSIIVASTMLSATACELGLNVTSTRSYASTQDSAYLHAASHARLACVPIALLLGALAAVLLDQNEIALGAVLGATLSLWTGSRAADQARQDYRTFATTSFLTGSLRVILGFGALHLYQSAVLCAIAIYAIAPLVALAFHRRPTGKVTRKRIAALREMAPYAFHMYVSGIFLAALLYAPQIAIAHRLDNAAIGTYGIILTFSGPISLVVYSIRSVLLPKFFDKTSDIEQLLWSKRGFFSLLATWASMVFGSAIIALLLQRIYGGQYADLALSFVVYFAGFSGMSAIGFYSLSVHTLNVAHLNSLVNLARVGTLGLLLLLFGDDLLTIVTMTACIMLLGEAILAILLHRLRSQQS